MCRGCRCSCTGHGCLCFCQDRCSFLFLFLLVVSVLTLSLPTTLPAVRRGLMALIEVVLTRLEGLTAAAMLQ